MQVMEHKGTGINLPFLNSRQTSPEVWNLGISGFITKGRI